MRTLGLILLSWLRPKVLTVPFVGGYYCGCESDLHTEPEDRELIEMNTCAVVYLYEYQKAKRRWWCIGEVEVLHPQEN